MIKNPIETELVGKWIMFKSNKHIGFSSTKKKFIHLESPKIKDESVPSKYIFFLKGDQSEEKLPSKENLKLVTDSNSGKGPKHMQM